MDLSPLKSVPKLTVQVVRNFVKTFFETEIMLLATSLAFSTIFALVPVVALFMAISQLAGNFWHFADDFKQQILVYVAAGSGQGLVEQLSASLAQMNPRGMGLFGLIGVLFTSVKMMYDLDTTVVRIWQGKRQASWWKRGLVYMVILVFSPIALSVAAGVLDWEVLHQFVAAFLTTASVLFFVCLFLCFKFSPPVEISKRAALIGTLFSYVGLSLGKELYTWATVNIFSYNKLYGSLAFLPLFLFWLFFIWCLILGGLTLTKAVNDLLEGGRDRTVGSSAGEIVA